MTSSRRSIPTIDRISFLPDSILCHILSFLSTKHAATTSVLSKRWKPLWLSVFSLHLDITAFESSPSTFYHAIYSTLQRRYFELLPIHSFSFICGEGSRSIFNPKEFNLFIEFVCDRRVQNFTLHLNIPSLELPQCILNCETLEVLNLKGVKFGDISHLQDIHLPKLKTLDLNDVLFERNHHLYNLLLGCPLLQDFESKSSISFNYKENIYPLQISKPLPNLIKAKLQTNLIVCPLTMFANTNLLSLHMTTLSWLINHFRHYATPMFQRLTQLEINVQDLDWYCKCTWLLDILKHSPKLQYLTIQDTRVLPVWDNKCWVDPQMVPECLSSKLKTCYISGYEGKQWDFKFAKYIIENSKVLNTMAIHSKSSFCINDKYRMLGELSSCGRGSTTCKLLFD